MFALVEQVHRARHIFLNLPKHFAELGLVAAPCVRQHHLFTILAFPI